jgi:hypothetical protein
LHAFPCPVFPAFAEDKLSRWLADDTLTLAIVELWQKGVSARQIAEALSRQRRQAISRNAVIGRIFRARALDPQIRSVERLAGAPKAKRKRPYRPKPRPIFQKVQMPLLQAQPPLRLVPLVLPSGLVVPWHAAGGCSYISNDDVRAPIWCNAPGSPWCAFHDQKLHTKMR